MAGWIFSVCESIAVAPPNELVPILGLRFGRRLVFQYHQLEPRPASSENVVGVALITGVGVELNLRNPVTKVAVDAPPKPDLRDDVGAGGSNRAGGLRLSPGDIADTRHGGCERELG